MEQTQSRTLWQQRTVYIACFSATAIMSYVVLRFLFRVGPIAVDIPLVATLIVGGVPLVFDLIRKMVQRQFGSDLLAGISIITSAILGEYLAGAIVVLMLSGGDVLENMAVANASSVLHVLAKRMPRIAHRKVGNALQTIGLEDIAIDDLLVIHPHEICPVDGVVADGRSTMDESFLTGEPFVIAKTPGATVISGAVNGDSALTIRAKKLPSDSRYAKIMEVMKESALNRPNIRRLGDQLGAIYTPIALGLAALAWGWTGDPTRFLAVLVIATPCPLLIGIPVAIIGAVTSAARRGIIVKKPAVLEQVDSCQTIILDKTGTLTYGQPKLTDQFVAPGFDGPEVLSFAGSLELYSKHPLAHAILDAAQHAALKLDAAEQISEAPGQGLRGRVRDMEVCISSRNRVSRGEISGREYLPSPSPGLECCISVNGRLAATYRFHDAPRREGRSFIRHLGPRHHLGRVMLLSGDREPEVRYLAEQVGITDIHAQATPEQKLDIVRHETQSSKTVYVGDGINDAPAMMAATVGIAIGQNSDVTAQAADVVIMEGALRKVDELFHLGRRMRRIALQSAIGGMALSIAGMGFASAGLLTPVAGAITQELIDLAAVLNALRTALQPRSASDMEH